MNYFFEKRGPVVLMYVFFALFFNCSAHDAITTTQKEVTLENRELRDIAEWSVLVFIQADNDLAPFAEYNVASMEKGFQDTPVNLLVQWDKPHEQKTNRYLITSAGRIDVGSLALEMGYDPQRELTDSMAWMISNYPAKRYAVILWNHGSGIEDLFDGGFSASKPLPKSYASSSWLEIPGLFSSIEYSKRGILYDYAQGTLLTNQGLAASLSQIKDTLGRKIDVIGMDACMMAMLEVAYQIKDYAQYLVTSQETEPGNGWAYEGFIHALTTQPDMSAVSLCSTIVSQYADYYRNQEPEPSFTQSAFDLSLTDGIRRNLDAVIKALADCAAIDALWSSLAKKTAYKATDSFSVAKYLDLYAWYENLEKQALALKEPLIADAVTRSRQNGARPRLKREDRMKINVVQKQNLLQKRDLLVAVLRQGKALITSFVIANETGLQHNNAHGVSIYYPTKTQGIHYSYKNTQFWKDSLWAGFIPLA